MNWAGCLICLIGHPAINAGVLSLVRLDRPRVAEKKAQHFA